MKSKSVLVAVLLFSLLVFSAMVNAQILALSDNTNDGTANVSASLTSPSDEDKMIQDYISAGIESEKSAAFDTAILYFNMAIKLRDNCAEAYDHRGMIYVLTLKFEKAIRDFNKAIKLEPDNAEAYNHRGMANYCLRQFDLALRDYSMAIEMKPGLDKAYYNRGILYLEEGDKDSAFRDLSEAFRMHNQDAAQVIRDFFQE